jgi:hypothetical protein
VVEPKQEGNQIITIKAVWERQRQSAQNFRYPRGLLHSGKASALFLKTNPPFAMTGWPLKNTASVGSQTLSKMGKTDAGLFFSISFRSNPRSFFLKRIMTASLYKWLS